MKKFFIFLMAAAIILSTFTACDNSDYKKAVKLMESGNYEEAKAIFTEISDYKNSAELITECDYNTAIDLMNSGNYKDALLIFASIEGVYKDSMSLAYDCNWGLAMDCFVDEVTDDYEGNTINIKTTDERDGLQIKFSGYMHSIAYSCSYIIYKDNPQYVTVTDNLVTTLKGEVVSLCGQTTINLNNYNSNSKSDWRITGEGYLEALKKIYSEWEVDSEQLSLAKKLDEGVPNTMDAIFGSSFATFTFELTAQGILHGFSLDTLGIPNIG